MSKKVPYFGITKKEYKKLLKRCKVVSTFVNENYVNQSKNMIREIEEQHRRNALKTAKDDISIGKAMTLSRKIKNNI